MPLNILSRWRFRGLPFRHLAGQIYQLMCGAARVSPIAHIPAILWQSRQFQQPDALGESLDAVCHLWRMFGSVFVVVREYDNVPPFKVAGVLWEPFLSAHRVRRGY